MSTAARKARKRAGIKFEPKPVKVGTPVEQRSFVTGPVFRRHGDEGMHFGTSRSPRRIERFILSGGRPGVNPGVTAASGEGPGVGLLRSWIERRRAARGENG